MKNYFVQLSFPGLWAESPSDAVKQVTSFLGENSKELIFKVTDEETDDWSFVCLNEDEED